MKQYITIDPWQIIEDGFHASYSRVSESLFSIANGFMGVRGFFEEGFSGPGLEGSYFAGIYYPDKTKVGWWKVGYPESFAKVPNAVNWIKMPIEIDGEPLDLATGNIVGFKRILNMQKGLLTREFVWESPGGKHVKCHFERFCSLADREIGAISLTIQMLSGAARVNCIPALDFDVYNEDANWDEQFWDHGRQEAGDGFARISAKTKKTEFTVCSAMCWDYSGSASLNHGPVEKDAWVGNTIDFKLGKEQELRFYKYVCNQSSLYHEPDESYDDCLRKVSEASLKGYATLKADHVTAWQAFWDHGDIRIEGDDAAQQGIRYNIFQLWQTYQGHDPRLNIGPKGFTGEKYGGSTYWDTEAYCLPFYLGSCERHIAKNLLLYRYTHLPKAIENAAKLGFDKGAALYPMVTMNGEECHNEWEITFEEIHRNGAIAYAIYDYIRYTGDVNYLVEGGLEVLIAIARFWTQRANWSEPKQKYVILGVTGPNEYENNINNNWYTNYIAVWCLRYAMEAVSWTESNKPSAWEQLKDKTRFEIPEMTDWQKVADGMYFPVNKALGIFLQQDDYLDKEQLAASDLPVHQRPLNQHWSWDRILRSCFIKQADVLQGLYFFEEHFSEDVVRRNFEFYEPKTVHESSLSPCVHAILAARLDKPVKAYEMYLRTARLDLEDYNNDTDEGLHITSMAGTWMAIVKGFAGVRFFHEKLVFNPNLPQQWRSLSFQIHFREAELKVKVTHQHLHIENLSDTTVEAAAGTKRLILRPESVLDLKLSELKKSSPV